MCNSGLAYLNVFKYGMSNLQLSNTVSISMGTSLEQDVTSHSKCSDSAPLYKQSKYKYTLNIHKTRLNLS